MKAITLKQPFATLVAIGAKTLDTHGWTVEHSGPIAIHSSMGFPRWAQELCYKEPFRSTLIGAGYRRLPDLPLGAILCVAGLRGIYRTDDVRPMLGAYGKNEVHFGDFSSRRFAFHLKVLTVLDPPISMRGQRYLWELPTDTSAFLLGRMHDTLRRQARQITNPQQTNGGSPNGN